MENDWAREGFDPRIEDPSKLPNASRRTFIGNLAKNASIGTALLVMGRESSATQVDDLFSMPKGGNPNDEEYWERIKDQFLVREGLTYLNSGSKGPSPRNVYQAHAESLEVVSSEIQHISNHYFSSDYARSLTNETRGKLAAFVGAKPNEIAFTNNTTEGMIFGIMGIDLKRHDQVLYTNHDHPFGCNPILSRAARDDLDVGMIDLSDARFHPPSSPAALLEKVDSALTSRTKLLCFCHINYTDGCIMPVKEICELARSKGIVTLVDGAQAPGMLAIDLNDLGCDMYAGACHKWLLAGMATGFLFVREDFQDQVSPVLYTGPTNGQTMHGPESDAAKARRLRNNAGASVFELRGSGDFASRVSINAALDFHNHITRKSVETRIRYMAGRLIRGLRDLDGVQVYVSEDPRLSCGLVSFSIDAVPTARVNADLWANNGLWIRSVTHNEIGWDANRASVHLMATVADVDRLIDAVGGLVA